MIDPEQPHEEETAEKEKAEAHILPKANIDRMVVASLPVATKTSMESKVILQYLASEFLAFIASEADSVSKVCAARLACAPGRGGACEPGHSEARAHCYDRARPSIISHLRPRRLTSGARPRATTS
jgi:histone H3/H4